VKRIFSPATTKVVFFDMNNTLVDPQRSFEKCFVNVLADFVGRWATDDDWNPQAVLETYLAEWNKKAKWLKKKPAHASEAKKQCLAAALKPYPFQVNDAFVSAFFREIKNQAKRHAVLYPYVLETLRHLSSRYRLAIISNGSKEHQDQVAERLNLTAYIPREHIFASKKGGFRKPNPAIFLNALKAMDIRAPQGVMVGDSWKNDVSGAMKCGMKTVWVYRLNAKKMSRRKVGKQTVVVVRSIRQLTDIFG